MKERLAWEQPKLVKLDASKTMGGSVTYPLETEICLVGSMVINRGFS